MNSPNIKILIGSTSIHCYRSLIEKSEYLKDIILFEGTKSRYEISFPHSSFLVAYIVLSSLCFNYSCTDCNILQLVMYRHLSKSNRGTQLEFHKSVDEEAVMEAFNRIDWDDPMITRAYSLELVYCKKYGNEIIAERLSQLDLPDHESIAQHFQLEVIRCKHLMNLELELDLDLLDTSTGFHAVVPVLAELDMVDCPDLICFLRKRLPVEFNAHLLQKQYPCLHQNTVDAIYPTISLCTFTFQSTHCDFDFYSDRSTLVYTFQYTNCKELIDLQIYEGCRAYIIAKESKCTTYTLLNLHTGETAHFVDQKGSYCFHQGVFYRLNNKYLYAYDIMKMTTIEIGMIPVDEIDYVKCRLINKKPIVSESSNCWIQ